MILDHGLHPSIVAGQDAAQNQPTIVEGTYQFNEPSRASTPTTSISSSEDGDTDEEEEEFYDALDFFPSPTQMLSSNSSSRHSN